MSCCVMADKPSVKHQDKIRVLIADGDHVLARRLAEFVSARGFEARAVNNGKDARAQILDWKPRFVLADLMLPDGGALHMIEFIKNEPTLRHQLIHVMVVSGHNTANNVRQAINQGAKDYIVKPFRQEDVLKRLIFHSRRYRQVRELSAKEYGKVDEASLMLHLTDLVLRQALGTSRLEEILFNLTRMVSLKVDGVRCSIIQCHDQKNGTVVTSNDDRGAAGIALDLYKYPEVLHVLNTQTLIAIENLDESLELRHVREAVRDISFNSMIVCPVTRFGRPFGVLSLRMPPEKITISDNEIRFVEIVSHVVSLVLSNELHKESGEFWLQNQAPAPIPLRAVKKS